MKSWWLDLYTIPALKSLLRATGIVLVCSWLLCFFVPALASQAIYFNLYTLFVLTSSFNHSVEENVEFHKLHVPYNSLRKAFLGDLGIRLFATLISLVFNLLVVKMFGNLQQLPFEAILIVVALPLTLILSFRFGVKPGTKNAPYAIWYPEDYNLIMKFFLISLSSVLSVFIIAALLLLGFQPITCMIIYFCSLLSGNMLYRYKAVFHRESRGSFKMLMKYQMKGLGLLGVFSLFIAGASYPLVNSDWVNPAIRLGLFYGGGRLTSNLDIKTAAMFIPVVETFDLDYVFKKTPGIGSEPIEIILPEINPEVLTVYVGSVEDISRENKIFILEKMSENLLKNPNDNYSRLVVEKVTKTWPKDEKFPEHLLVKKMKLEELPVSDSTRIPASED